MRGCLQKFFFKGLKDGSKKAPKTKILTGNFAMPCQRNYYHYGDEKLSYYQYHDRKTY